MSSPDPQTHLTHSQTQIWLGQRLHPESPLYNMAFAFVFPGALDPQRFRRAWRRVAEASDALRTGIQESACSVERGPADPTPETEVLDWRHRDWQDGENSTAAFHRWCRARSAHPLPLDGPLVDSVLVYLDEATTGWYLNQHHLITDAWSTLLLYREVAAEYAAAAPKDEAASTERPPLEPYYPTARSLAEDLARRADQRQRAQEHWDSYHGASGQNSGSPSIPLYGHAPGASGGETPSTANTRWTLELDSRRSRALEALIQEPGFRSLSPDLSRFALFATLLTAWLHRVGDRRELRFDAPVAGRPTAAAKRALGLFIEVFPFAVTVGPRETFRSLGARCLAEAQSFLRHALPGLSNPSGATAANVVLNYCPGSFGPFAGLEPAVEWVHPGHADSVHSLRLQVHDFAGSGRLTLHFDHHQGTLPEALQRRSLEHFEALLDALLEDPDHPIATVDLLTDEERSALASLNTAAAHSTDPEAAPEPYPTAIHSFLQQVRAEPQRTALRQGVEELTFGELEQRSGALAAALLSRGFHPGDRVLLPGRRSIDAVVAILAVLRAGLAYVPVDAQAPATRLEQILEDSGARLVLTDDLESRNLPPEVPAVTVSEELARGIEMQRAELGEGRELPEPSSQDLAYLLYTSGSTGRPKGVLVEHGGLADYLHWAEGRYLRGERMVFALCTSLAFDLTVTSLFLPLITGGTLEIYPEAGTEQAGSVPDTAFLAAAGSEAVEFLKLTPSHLALLVRQGLESSNLQRLIVGGEAFPPSLAAAVSTQLHERAEISNEYGPTEAVVGCIEHRYDPAEPPTGTSVAIGRPADHVTVEILNHARAPVPWGTPGELWVSLPGLARGYHRRPALTAQSFQAAPSAEPHPAPMHTHPGRRRYRTGDRVRLNDDGILEYLGRLDRQVKVSGFRIEPGEVEAALLALSQIEACAVLPRRRGPAPSAPSPGASSPRAGSATGLPLQAPTRHCARCGLSSRYPRAEFDGDGVCRICRSYEAIKDRAQAYFKTLDELQELFAASRKEHPDAPYDCMMLYSGGKDSTYALCRLVGMGLSVYTFTLDNGFISEGAKENIRRVAAQLAVPVEFATTPAINAIFRDSLLRFSNVCNGCFKTIYTLSMQRARELGIPCIVTGLSRGQMFETRLTEEMFRDGQRSAEEIDAAVLAARKTYHRMNDEVSRSLDVAAFQDDAIFEQVSFVDFYRYCDVELGEVLSYLRREVPWVRPEDTGRSTNCLINDAGIYVHKRERGFHNYALPYSWDVRLGHKDRDAALAELDDDLDESHVRGILAQVGYDPDQAAQKTGTTVLEAFYVPRGETSPEELRRRLAEHLPGPLVPSRFHPVEALPLTPNGKVDTDALAELAGDGRPHIPYRVPQGPVEEFLVEIWQDELGWQEGPETRPIGADDHFFELGGTSLAALQVMLRLCQEFVLDLPLDSLFSHPTLAQLARYAEDQILADDEELGEGD